MGILYLSSYGFESAEATRRIYEAMNNAFNKKWNQDLPENYYKDKKMFLVSLPEHCVQEKMTVHLVEIFGFQEDNLFFSEQGYPGEYEPDFIFVTAGNTFDVLDYMREKGIVTYIQEKVLREGVTYIGASAGAALAGKDIYIARDFDSPRGHGMEYDYSSFGFVEGAIVPHFTPGQLEDYLEEASPYLRTRYSEFMTVGNEEVIEVLKKECK